MADISAYVDSIKNATRGVEIRDPLAKALNAINTQGRDALTFGIIDGVKLGSDYYAKRNDLANLIPMDDYPIRKSKHLVKGGGIFAVIGNMDDFDWG